MIDVKAAEQSAIACLLLDPKKFMPHASEALIEEDFELIPCRNIFSACRKLFMSGKPIDIVTVLHELGSEIPEYREYLVSISQAVPTLHNAERYIEIVAENARRRRAMEACTELHTALSTGAALEECLELSAKVPQALNTKERACMGAADGFMAVYTGTQQPKRYIATGFERLDKCAMLDKGDYVVIGGRPSAGKTAFSLQVALQMAKKHKVVYFSLETSARKMYERAVSCWTGLSFTKILRGELTADEYALMSRAYDGFSKAQLQVVDAAGWSVPQIQAKAAQLQAEVICIDYLGLVHSAGKSLYERVSNTSIGLHTLAQQSGILVLALSQLSRAGAGDAPDLTHLRESGQVEQDADVVLLLYNADRDDPTAKKLDVAKNKSGRTGFMELYFDGDRQRFREVYDGGQ